MDFRAVRSFTETPTQEELEVDKAVQPEFEHLRGKIMDEQLEAIKYMLVRNQNVFL